MSPKIREVTLNSIWLYGVEEIVAILWELTSLCCLWLNVKTKDVHPVYTWILVIHVLCRKYGHWRSFYFIFLFIHRFYLLRLEEMPMPQKQSACITGTIKIPPWSGAKHKISYDCLFSSCHRFTIVTLSMDIPLICKQENVLIVS